MKRMENVQKMENVKNGKCLNWKIYINKNVIKKWKL